MLLMWGFGSEMPVVTLSLLLPLSSACVTHTNGNNFFQFLLAEVGGPVTCAVRGLLSSSPSLFCSGSHSLAAFLIPCFPLWMWVLPFKFLCFDVSSSAPLDHLLQS